jgi:hypothetical protein
MKRLAILLLLGSSYLSYAAPPPKQSIVRYSPKSDPAAFAFIPTPASCQLHLIASNQLVWVRYETRQHGRARVCDTTVYTQAAVDTEPTRIVSFRGREMPKVVGAITHSRPLN